MALMKRTIRFFIHLPPLQHHEHVFPLPKRDFLANDVRENIIIIEKKKEREKKPFKYWLWKVAGTDSQISYNFN